MQNVLKRSDTLENPVANAVKFLNFNHFWDILH